jgi:hypothetical protein
MLCGVCFFLVLLSKNKEEDLLDSYYLNF